MEANILVIGKANERLKLIRNLNNALLHKYRLIFYAWQSKNDLKDLLKKCAVVIISDFPAATRAATLSIQSHPEEVIPIIFISSQEKNKENFKKYTRFVTIGHNWMVRSLDDDFLDSVKSAINRSHHSHKMRTRLHVLRKQLKEQKPIEEHVPYYRQLLELEKHVHQKNKELVRINSELQKLDQLKSVFLSMTSHELKTPITPIKMSAQSLLFGLAGDLNTKQKESVEIILRNANHLNELISDVLDSAKIDAKQLKMYPQRTDLIAIIAEVTKDVNPMAKAKSITITTSVEKLPIVMIDAKRCRQVLWNLIGNSIKFTPPNGTITISAKQQSEYIIISITDTGIGIAPTMIKKIFDKFVQANLSYTLHQKGTGLGLSICRGIVTGFGGKIWAESKGENRGASFHFTIPIANVNK